MAKCIDRAPAKPSSARRRCVQIFNKMYHQKWPFIFIDGKGDTFVNTEVCSTVVKLLDWRTVECDCQTVFSAVRNR